MHCPHAPIRSEEARQSTLSWFIRALNGLEPKERRELLRQIPGPPTNMPLRGRTRCPAIIRSRAKR